MGGCATKPKDSNIRPDSLPIEAPDSPKNPEVKVETVVVAQEKVEEGSEKIQKEEPLVDLSEPKQDAGEDHDDSKVKDIFTPVKETAEKSSEVKGEAEKEEKAKEAVEVKGEAEKERKTKEAVVDKVQEVGAAASTAEVKTEKIDATSIAQNKKDVPIVIV